MKEGHVVPALEEHDIHKRRRLVQIMAPPFGNGWDRQEQSAVEPRQRGELAEERKREDRDKNIRYGISKPHIWWLWGLEKKKPVLDQVNSLCKGTENKK